MRRRVNGVSRSDGEIITDVRRSVGYFKLDERTLDGPEIPSAHGVLLGTLPNYGEVAVKPHSNIRKAEQESSNLLRATEKGLLAIEPLEVAVGGVATYLITRREPGLTDLRTAPWNVNVASRALRSQVIPTLHQAANALGGLHAAGVVHGDYTPRNAMFTADRLPIYGDAENSHINPTGDLAVRLASKDVTVFGKGVMTSGLLADRSPAYRADFLTSELVDPYLEVAQANPTMGIPAQRRQELHDTLVGIAQKQVK
jgi:hypothetical protein